MATLDSEKGWLLEWWKQDELKNLAEQHDRFLYSGSYVHGSFEGLPTEALRASWDTSKIRNL